MNLFKTDSVLKDVQYRVSTINPFKWDNEELAYCVTDLTEWISVKKERLVKNFIDTTSENVIEILRDVYSILKDYNELSLLSLLLSKDSPLKKYNDIKSAALNEHFRHWDEEDFELDDEEQFIPKQEIAEWTERIFFIKDESQQDDDTTYDKDGEILN